MRSEKERRAAVHGKRFFRAAGMLLLALALLCSDAADMICMAEGTGGQEERTEGVTISTVQELLGMANACREDWYSYGKDFYLESDLDLTGSGFCGIAFFNGSFHGNGHKITGVWLDGKGSDAGFFRYVGSAGSVEDLQVEGRIGKEGAAERVGGIVGVNFGLISGCTFQGEVNADTDAGGIAGYNKADGRILDCTSTGQITATNQTGGICGENKGIIQNCVNEAVVNGDDLKATLNLNGVDLGQFNFTQNVVTRNDSGGIAGYSSGTISGCINYGPVGYAHVGYNVGGIAGRHNGTIIDCRNEGEILGRKDVGGIVGQAEPYMESEYLSDRLEKLQDDLGRMNRLVIQMSDAVSRTSSEASEYTRTLQQQYEDTVDSLNREVNTLRDSISEDREETRGYIDSISQALENMSEIGNDTVNRVMNDVNNTINDVNRTVNDVREEVTNRIDQVTDRLDPDKIGLPGLNPDKDGDGDGDSGEDGNGSGNNASSGNGGSGSSNGNSSTGGNGSSDGTSSGDSTSSGSGENGSAGSGNGGNGSTDSGSSSSGGGNTSSSGGGSDSSSGSSGDSSSGGDASSSSGSGDSSSGDDGGSGSDGGENHSSDNEGDGGGEARGNGRLIMTGAGHGEKSMEEAGPWDRQGNKIPVVWKGNVRHPDGKTMDAEVLFCTSESGGEGSGEGAGEENDGRGTDGDGSAASPDDTPERPQDPDYELPSVDPDRVKDEFRKAEESISRKEYLKPDPDPEIKNNLNRMQEEISGISGSIRGMYDTISGTEESVGDAAGNVSNELTDQSKLSGDTIDDLADSVDGGIQSVTSSLNGLMSTQQQIRNSVGEDLDILMGNEEALLDLSSGDVAGRTQGVVSGCVNEGCVEADLNLGGIAGTMNVEYDFSPEMDLDLTGLTDVTVRSTTYNVLIHCINYGRVTARKNGCGGIVGREDLGMIYDCENYGSLCAESGSRVGGIAGISASSIAGSYSFCNISGTDYLGGISGEGFNISDCAAICRIESDQGECVGSIAGHVDEEASVSGNWFVSDQWEGIDNISYYGAAMGCTYEELMEMGMPQGFSMVTVTFEQEDEEVGSLRIPYGGTVEEADVPQIAPEEGYLQWDHDFPIRQVTENLVISAEKRNWITGLASEETDERGKSYFLVEGKFHENASIVLTECDEKKSGAVWNMIWTLEGSAMEEDFTSASCIGHFLIPEGADGAEVWILRDKSWQQAETETDGAYLTASIRAGEAFAVCPVYENRMSRVYAGCAAGILLAVFLLLIRRRKKKRG